MASANCLSLCSGLNALTRYQFSCAIYFMHFASMFPHLNKTVDVDLRHNMVTLGHNELNRVNRKQ